MGQVFLGYPIITKTGATIATSGTSASTAIPNSSGAIKPAYIRLSATAACTVRLTGGASTALTTDVQVQPGDSLILAVPLGVDTVSAIQVTGPGILNITPLENA